MTMEGQGVHMPPTQGPFDFRGLHLYTNTSHRAHCRHRQSVSHGLSELPLPKHLIHVLFLFLSEDRTNTIAMAEKHAHDGAAKTRRWADTLLRAKKCTSNALDMHTQNKVQPTEVKDIPFRIT